MQTKNTIYKNFQELVAKTNTPMNTSNTNTTESVDAYIARKAYANAAWYPEDYEEIKKGLMSNYGMTYEEADRYLSEKVPESKYPTINVPGGYDGD